MTNTALLAEQFMNNIVRSLEAIDTLVESGISLESKEAQRLYAEFDKLVHKLEVNLRTAAAEVKKLR